MTAFQQALKHTLKWEGGSKFTDDPHYPGGATKYGISKRAFPDLDIPNLTYEQAGALEPGVRKLGQRPQVAAQERIQSYC